jgi:glycosyltransferase involved in cell wall biosynthesis
MVEFYNIVITPAKDEEDNLPDLIKSVGNQSIPPLLWVIVDDGSVDSTPTLIKEAENKYPFIKSLRLGPHPRDIGAHYAYVCKMGFDFAIDYCEKNEVQLDYISLVDGDMSIEPDFFEKIFFEFDKNSNLGIVSGGVYYKKVDKIILEETSGKLPRGGCRVWNYNCFKETDGYQISICPDSVSNVKAILRGWEIMQLQNAVSVQSRPTSGAEGLWRGFISNGNYAYCLNKNPVLVFMNFIHFIIKKPHYIGIAYLYGYLISTLKRSTKIKDEEVKNYYWNTKIKEYLNIKI